MPPVVRRPHRKSRNGCINCKRRKVKCDEQKPKCANCIRHELDCSFLGPDRASSSTSPPSSVLSPRVHNPVITRGPSESHGLSIPQLLSPMVAPSQDLNMAHLELFYHWVTSTSYTMSNNESIKLLYQTTVAKLALGCDYVMKSVLAIAAIHLAYLKPDQQHFYMHQATELHHAALTKGSQALSNLTQDNCEPTWIFAALLCVFALGKPKHVNDSWIDHDAGIAEWLLMFRGNRIVIQSCHKLTLQSGVLSPIFQIGGRRAQMQFAVGKQIDHLWMLHRSINDVTLPPNQLEVYNIAMEELEQTYKVVYNLKASEMEPSDVFVWLYRVSEDYLDLLRQKKPEALVIFAYFAALIKRLEPLWWVSGWSVHLISHIYRLLGEEHRLWINLPMREIGWIP